jgi:YgiT-type zinc finger domain-containing protein
MREVRCNFCSSNRFEERRVEYLYSHKGQYLLVPNTPVEVCLDCGMVYYDAVVLKAIERQFFCYSTERIAAGSPRSDAGSCVCVRIIQPAMSWTRYDRMHIADLFPTDSAFRHPCAALLADGFRDHWPAERVWMSGSLASCRQVVVK